ncbi:MAG TPA: response regulator, partial [Gemmatimonadales bacterium]|nr:response regulator [Gemmatimonadales bacterium]
FQRHPGRFSALLADVVMPRVPGTELVARVRAIRPELPALLMTGYTQAELLTRGFEIQGAQVLTKPFRPAALVSAVRKLFEGMGDPNAPADRG